MCFSANASFLSAGIIGAIGVATLRQVREPRTVLFASIPLLFALHQFTEGLVWLGLEGRTGQLALDHAAFLYLLYAVGLLPLLLPIAVALIEPPGWRRGAILVLTAIGALISARHSYGVFVYPSEAVIEQNAIAYHNPLTADPWLSGLYVAVTCGALLLSTQRVVRMFGILNVIGLMIVQFTMVYAFASVWCFYAAILSTVIYWQFDQGAFDSLLTKSVTALSEQMHR